MTIRVLLLAEHASARFGGEAALPLHYFRVLLARGVPVWLVTHARVRKELSERFADSLDRITFIEDRWYHVLLWRISAPLPARLAYVTTGYLSRVLTQLTQRRLARDLITRHGISVVHQPMPVSPKEPSFVYGLGVPVVIGPMNGGMDYPPAFRHPEPWISKLVVKLGRSASHLLNLLAPGKREAACLLVANERTERALPRGASSRVETIVENGVDLSLWKPVARVRSAAPDAFTRFVFMGRLVDWKAVDLLIEAFDRARQKAPMALSVIGDGAQAPSLKQMVRDRGLEGVDGRMAETAGTVAFAGWKTQTECALALHEQDVLVLPSLMECGGAVVLEAMAAGLPVIATAWGGPLDYLDDTCGVLVPPASREGLIAGFAEALVDLSVHPERREAMGHAGRHKVAMEFDWDAKVDAVTDIYRSVTSGR